MRKLDQDSFKRMIAGARVISKDQYGDKVLRLPDGPMVKLFRLKRRFSSAVIWPYAKRFERGVRRLRGLGIPTVKVMGTYRVSALGRDAVFYVPLEGATLREALDDPENKKSLIKSFSAFFATLHERGVYFRAIHFGNVIVLPDGEFGLIDVSELRVSQTSLSVRKRVRNFKPIFRYKEDRTALLDYGLGLFLDSYAQHSSLSSKARNSFLGQIKGLYGVGSDPDHGH